MSKGKSISLAEAIQELSHVKTEFVELFQHGSLSIELYSPDQIDKQTPHKRDEVYIVASGEGSFFCNGQTTRFTAGQFLFVPAGEEHYFHDFTSDFKTWVIFYGPQGGESKDS